MRRSLCSPPDVNLDLDVCAREPIQIPGTIQPHGALLVASTVDVRLLQFSRDLGAVVGMRPSPGQPLADVMARRPPTPCGAGCPTSRRRS